ncbi:MAG: GvpL/GvpF family gas vesicle protein [Streptosporangiaceae bacterium]
MAAETQNGQQGSRQTYCYVYGIIPADTEVAPDATGVGDPPGAVSIVRQGDIAALVSEIDPDRSLGSPQDLTAHQSLLDATAAGAIPVLPIRFGAVLADRDAVANELLVPHHDQFAAALAELEDKTEFVVKGRYSEENLLREILSEDERAARLSSQIAGTDEDATRDLRIQLGEIIGAAVAARRQRDTAKLADLVRDHVIAVSPREPSHEEDAVNLAVLVSEDQRDDLLQSVDKLAGAWSGRVDLRVLGPLAPYDFVVTTDQAAGA